MHYLVVNLCLAVAVQPFLPPTPTPVSLPNPGFEEPLGGTWAASAEHDDAIRRDTTEARAGQASIRFRAAGERACVSLAEEHAVAVKPGETWKFGAWVRVTDATGETCLALDGYGGSAKVARLASSRKLGGTTPGWVFRWVLADVPGDGTVTHLRPTLNSDDNSGTAWFDDVKLTRLGPDEPVVTGPPPAPPRGQISAKGGHLVGADGERVRLWGINCVDEPGRTYREITHIARRVKQLGFNAVRLHLYDGRFIDREAKTADGEATTLVFQQPARGDRSSLDKLDYFIYCVEREGLYLYMTFDRTRCRFAPGDYHVMPSAGAEDEAAWKAAVQELQTKRADERATFVDPRLGAAQAHYVETLLDHRNGYSGRRVADDPNVALYELTNENHFPERALTGGFRKWPQYFQDVLRARWNAWLAARYGGEARLREAWDGLKEGESLVNGTVEVAPVLGEAKDHGAERLADVHRFIYDLFVTYSRRLEKTIHEAGTSSARTPVSWDTLHEHKHKWYYPCSQGSLMSVGTYVRGHTQPDPERRRLKPGFKGFYNLSFASVLDRPTVIYETNTLKPDCWRADYPMIVAAFTSTHDWDGVFFYNFGDGTVPDQFDDDTYVTSGLRYAAPAHIWHGIVSCTDEVLLAGMRLAGEIFRSFAIPATDPVIATVGSKDLLGPDLWVGDIDVPYPADAPLPYRRSAALSATDLLQTVRYTFDMNREESALSRPLIAQPPQPCSPVAGLTYDCEQGVLTIDRPKAKAVVGFFGQAASFDGGVAVEVEVMSSQFACFGMAATDGLPLAESKRAVLVLTTFGENRGRRLRPDPKSVPGNASLHSKQVKSWGWGPPDLVRPGAQVRLPGHWRWVIRDFRLDALAEGEGDVLRIADGMPVFRVELRR